MSRILEQTHVVVDLETYGTRPGSVILQIGAKAFNRGTELTVNDNFSTTINYPDSVGFGFTVDQSTVDWWKKQPTQLHRAVLSGVKSVAEALDSFEDFILTLYKESHAGLNIWGNSNDFDLGLLKAYYHRFDQETPWKFRDERDFRTLKEVFRVDYEEIKQRYNNPCQHDAYCDARWEASILEDMLAHLEGN